MGQDQNPWKTLDSRLVYQNPWITVREDKVIRPDGKPGIYGVVETRLATGVVALSADLQVYLVGQYRYPTKHYSWEIVEGGSDKEESALHAAQRELKEETGLEAASWLQLGCEFHLSNCFTSEVGYVFLARELREGASAPDGTEILRVRKIPFSEAIGMVDSGEIKDMVSIVGLLRAERYLQGRAHQP
jgi:8-oxo-dGTP pyrophosphatase MutT (NUDIX family)